MSRRATPRTSTAAPPAARPGGERPCRRALGRTWHRSCASSSSAAQLQRIAREVDPVLEISAIAQRVMRAGGPALLFERVKGSRFPLLINTYATRQRMSWALGVADLDEHARAIGELVRSQPPDGPARQAAHAAQAGARRGGDAQDRAHAPPARRSSRRDVDLGKLPILTTWPDDGGPFITLPMVITRDPDTGDAQRRLYRMQVYARARPACTGSCTRPARRHMRRYKELGSSACRWRSRWAAIPVLHLRGDRAAARRHRRVAVRRLPAPQAGRDGPLQDRRPRGARRRRTSCWRATSTSTSCAAKGRSAITPATTRWPTTTRCSTSRRITRARAPDLRRRRSSGRPPQEDAWLGKATERLFLPLLQMTFPEIVDMNLPIEGVFHNLVHRLDQEGVPAPRAQDLSFAVGHGADDVREVHRGRRRRRQRAERARGRLAGAEQHRRQARRVLRRGADRRAGPRVGGVRLRRQAGRRRHAQVEGRRVHARVARGPEDGPGGRSRASTRCWKELGL